MPFTCCRRQTQSSCSNAALSRVLHSFLSPQVDYAGLDAYAGVLLYKEIIANADPIHFSAPPEASELVQGKRLQLYIKRSHAFVALGVVVAPL